MPATPLEAPNRLMPMDSLRGLAVLGILIMNIMSFGLPAAAYVNPFYQGTSPGFVDSLAWIASRLFADTKFLSLFSLLFGAGLVMQGFSAKARGDNPTQLHLRRMGWLLLFGLSHAVFIWYGDILVPYAVSGLIFFAFRGKSPRSQLIMAGVCLGIVSLLQILGWVGLMFAPPEATDAMMVFWQPGTDALLLEIETVRGPYDAQLEKRLSLLVFFYLQFLPLLAVWKIGSMMLIGMAMFKLGILAGRLPDKIYARLAWIGLGIGFPLVAAGLWIDYQTGWRPEISQTITYLLLIWGGTFQAVGYLGAFYLVFRQSWSQGVMTRLAAVGRMAFSNYIATSVIASLIFYGHGLGLFGRFGYAGLIPFVIGIWVVILLWSPWWLARYHRGPLEWMWRRLSYGQPVPFKKTSV